MLRRVEGDGLRVLLYRFVVVLGLEGLVAFGLGGFGGHLFAALPGWSGSSAVQLCWLVLVSPLPLARLLSVPELLR
jgi:hypothetical protein